MRPNNDNIYMDMNRQYVNAPYDVPRVPSLLASLTDRGTIVDTHTDNDDDSSGDYAYDEPRENKKRQRVGTCKMILIMYLFVCFVLILCTLLSEVGVIRRDYNPRSAKTPVSKLQPSWSSVLWLSRPENKHKNASSIRHYIDQLSVAAYTRSFDDFDACISHIARFVYSLNDVNFWFTGIRATVSLANAKLALIDAGWDNFTEIDEIIDYYTIDFDQVKVYNAILDGSNVIWNSYAYIVKTYPVVDKSLVRYLESLTPCVASGTGFRQDGMYVAHKMGRLITYAKVYLSGVVDVMSAMLQNEKITTYFVQMRAQSVILFSKFSHPKTNCLHPIFHDRGGRYLFNVDNKIIYSTNNIFIYTSNSVVVVNSEHFLYTTIGHRNDFYLAEIDVSDEKSVLGGMIMGNRPLFDDTVRHQSNVEPFTFPAYFDGGDARYAGRDIRRGARSFAVVAGEDTKSNILLCDANTVMVVNHITFLNVNHTFKSIEIVNFEYVCKIYVGVFPVQDAYVSYSWPFSGVVHTSLESNETDAFRIYKSYGFPGVTVYTIMAGTLVSVTSEFDGTNTYLLASGATDFVGTCIVFNGKSYPQIRIQKPARDANNMMVHVNRYTYNVDLKNMAIYYVPQEAGDVDTA